MRRPLGAAAVVVGGGSLPCSSQTLTIPKQPENPGHFRPDLTDGPEGPDGSAQRARSVNAATDCAVPSGSADAATSSPRPANEAPLPSVERTTESPTAKWTLRVEIAWRGQVGHPGPNGSGSRSFQVTSELPVMW